MKKETLFTTFIVLFCYAIYGQIVTGEAPISFELNVPVLIKNDKTMKSFAALDMKKIEQEDQKEYRKDIPPRFGYPHNAGFNLENSGAWVVLKNGDRLWRLVISCKDALTINLLYDKFWIPDGAKFFVYGRNRKQAIGAITSINNKGTKSDIHGFATGLVYGDQITLEYFLPSEVKDMGVISIASVVHGYKNVLKAGLGYGESGACNINVNCSQGQSWQNEKKAIALILVGGSRWCSGSLVNTTANDGRPLFLTANHCLTKYGNDAISAPYLNTWSFYWNYESPVCTSSYDPPFVSTSGATVVANNPASDFALFMLSEDPKNISGFAPYYLGWDRSGFAGTGGVGMHHPSGDIKKFSVYSITPTTMTYNSATVAQNAHWRVFWSNGTTEGGSSGSPLINSTRSIIGQLHGGLAACNDLNNYDSYGKFNVSWTGNGTVDKRRRLSDWLDPNNTGVSVLGGCDGVVNFTNQTVATNTTVTSCSNLNVQNVNVQNGSKLTLTAPNVNISADFNVQNGAELMIRAIP